VHTKTFSFLLTHLTAFFLVDFSGARFCGATTLRIAFYKDFKRFRRTFLYQIHHAKVPAPFSVLVTAKKFYFHHSSLIPHDFFSFPVQVIGWIVGFFLQSFKYTFYIIAAGAVLAVIVRPNK
jgi:hypothetical protein